jgi:hypothetical protein
LPLAGRDRSPELDDLAPDDGKIGTVPERSVIAAFQPMLPVRQLDIQETDLVEPGGRPIGQNIEGGANDGLPGRRSNCVHFPAKRNLDRDRPPSRHRLAGRDLQHRNIVPPNPEIGQIQKRQDSWRCNDVRRRKMGPRIRRSTLNRL